MKTRIPLTTILVLSTAICSPALANEVGDCVARLGHPEASERELAAIDLCELGERAAPAVPALREALRDTSTRVRWAAAEALSEIGEAAHPAAEDLVEFALRGEGDYEREIGWQALEDLKPDGVRTLVERAWAAKRLKPADLDSLLYVLGEDVVPLVALALESNDSSWRFAGLETLLTFPTEMDVKVQEQELDWKPGLQDWKPGLEDDDDADDAVMEFDPEIDPDQFPDLDLDGGGGSGEFNFDESGSCVEGVLGFEDSDYELAWTLPAEIPLTLAKLLGSEDERGMVLDALLHLNTQAQPAVQELAELIPSPECSDLALTCLFQLADLTPVKSTLLAALQNERVMDRDMLPDLLVGVPGEDVTAALLGALNDPEPEVRYRTASSLSARQEGVLAIAEGLVALLEREGPPPSPQEGGFNFDSGEPHEAASASLETLARRDPQSVTEAAQDAKREDVIAELGRILERAAR